MTDELVGFTAFKEERDDYGVLKTKPNQLLNRLRRIVGEKWSEGADPSWIRRYVGMLDRLRSFLLQARRMRDHEADLVSLLKVQRPPAGHSFQAVHAGDEACTDFESLLFHARAALDRLSGLVASEYGQRLDRFSRLESFLRGSVAKTHRTKSMLELISACEAIKGAVVDLEGGQSLRSRVIHRSSLSEGIVSNFTVITLENGRVLFLDCEAFGHGVLTLSRDLTTEVSFLVLNTVKLCLTAGTPLAMSNFRQKGLPVAVLSDYASDDERDPVVQVARIGPDGFTTTSKHVRRDLFRMARRQPQ